jgi:hypothetical protein
MDKYSFQPFFLNSELPLQNGAHVVDPQTHLHNSTFSAAGDISAMHQDSDIAQTSYGKAWQTHIGTQHHVAPAVSSTNMAPPA